MYHKVNNSKWADTCITVYLIRVALTPNEETIHFFWKGAPLQCAVWNAEYITFPEVWIKYSPRDPNGHFKITYKQSLSSLTEL